MSTLVNTGPWEHDANGFHATPFGARGVHATSPGTTRGDATRLTACGARPSLCATLLELWLVEISCRQACRLLAEIGLVLHQLVEIGYLLLR